jgi:Z1 domain-containing protein
MTTAAQEDALQRAVRTVLAMLPQDHDLLPEDVASACEDVYAMLARRNPDLDLAALQREVEHRVTIWQAPASSLDDNKDHIEWLPAVKVGIDWQFWDRYRRYLEDVKLLPRQVVRRLGEATFDLLGKIENPKRPGTWRRYGLVVGQVQSGKTGNYIGLTCRAADAGYKLIIILAGIDNGLRSQTQLRVDEGFLGFDTQYQQRYDQKDYYIGVGSMPGALRLKAGSFTTSAEKGDFRRAVASNMNIPVGDYPVVLVIKKHTKIMEYVRKWIVEVHGQPAPDGKKLVRDVPLLVIDDEADNASVNVAAEEDEDPTKVNGAIRRLLASFDKSSYIGYTATPFANIYMDPGADHAKYGDDLFPSHFIENLQAPSNYFGPERVFGLQADDSDDDDVQPLPIVRHVDDYADWLPNGHKKDWLPPAPIPDSLREAIAAFVLTCAARQARGQVTDHKSMLIHVSRFVDVQDRVADQVRDYLQLLKDRIRYGDGNEAAEGELRRLWDHDFAATSAAFPVDAAPRVSWGQVWAEIPSAAEKIHVKVLNGGSDDALQYYEHRKEGISVIAVGGTMLSRGLTLEGLAVSYYLRASKAYDTLLQMGRWFGYRPDYEDLCRLYTTPALVRAYAEITAADAELRREFDVMAALRATPEEFGLKVRTSSAGLEITARNKMRRSQLVKVSYSGDIPETVNFDMRDAALDGNLAALAGFVGRLDHAFRCDPDTETGSIVWTGVTPDEIVDGFLRDYTAAPAPRTRPVFIADYIRSCQRLGELGSWTVRLVSSLDGDCWSLDGHTDLGLIRRKPKNDDIEAGERYRIGRLVSPSDEGKDLIKGSESWNRALDAARIAAAAAAPKDGKARKEPDFPAGPPLRRQRSPSQAHLLIYPLKDPRPARYPDAPPVVGFAISFPCSANATRTAVEYRVNDVWQKQALGTDYVEDDE